MRKKFFIEEENNVSLNSQLSGKHGFCCAYSEFDDDLPTDLGGGKAFNNFGDDSDTQAPGVVFLLWILGIRWTLRLAAIPIYKNWIKRCLLFLNWEPWQFYG